MLGFLPLASAPLGGTSLSSQAYTLDATSVFTSAPTVDTPTLAIVFTYSNLTAAPISTASFVVGSASIWQEQYIYSSNVTAQPYVVSLATAVQKHSLVAAYVTTSIPTIDTTTLVDKTVVVGSSITTAIPYVHSTNIWQLHNVVPTNVVAEKPVVGSPNSAFTFVLQAVNILSGSYSVLTSKLTAVDSASFATNYNKGRVLLMRNPSPYVNVYAVPSDKRVVESVGKIQQSRTVTVQQENRIIRT